MSDPAEDFYDDELEAEMPDSSLDPAEEVADWGGGELEAAYLKAMMALEASEAEMPEIPSPPSSTYEMDLPVENASQNPSAGAPEVDLDAKREQARSALAELLPTLPDTPSEKIRPESAVDVRLNPRQILEACLFVGGSALPAGKLSTVLRGDFDSDFVDKQIDELNRLYAAESRPYEIRLGEGGYRLTLREEFERIRYKVYGLGPKEVRLSQDSLEVLAIVAYHQPIKQAAVEEMGKPNCGAVLRQLVRRELLAVERDPEQPRDVFYKTTPRFLSLFGIRKLDDLPRHEQVGYK